MLLLLPLLFLKLFENDRLLMFLLLLFLLYRDNSVTVENPVTQVEREEMVVARTNALRKGKCKDLFVAHL